MNYNKCACITLYKSDKNYTFLWKKATASRFFPVSQTSARLTGWCVNEKRVNENEKEASVPTQHHNFHKFTFLYLSTNFLISYPFSIRCIVSYLVASCFESNTTGVPVQTAAKQGRQNERGISTKKIYKKSFRKKKYDWITRIQKKHLSTRSKKFFNIYFLCYELVYLFRTISLLNHLLFFHFHVQQQYEYVLSIISGLLWPVHSFF